MSLSFEAFPELSVSLVRTVPREGTIPNREGGGMSKDSGWCQEALIEYSSSLAGAAQWIEYWPANPEVASSIPGLGTCLGCRPGM